MNISRYVKKLSKAEYTGISPGISRISAILAKLGYPQDAFPSVHIAGTNGKGSTAAMISSIFANAGYKTGLYTSPHLIDAAERIQINGIKISRKEFNSAFMRIMRFPESKNLTYFELMTAVAFIHYSLNNIDIAVCETGLGGKFDATNVINKTLASVITKIDFDHTEILGNSLKKIAEEKTGIIKNKSPVIVSPGQNGIIKIIVSKARKKKAQAFFGGKDYSTRQTSTNWGNFIQLFDFYNKNSLIKNIPLHLMGKHQIENAGAAIQTSLTLKKNGFKINDINIKNSLKCVRWPARFDLRPMHINGRRIQLIIDGAHNPDGMRNLKQALMDYTAPLKNKFTFIFSSMREKNYNEMAKIISPVVKKIILYRPDNPRAASCNELNRGFEKYLPQGNIICSHNYKTIFKNIQDENLIVAAGSLYLAGELLNRIGNHK